MYQYSEFRSYQEIPSSDGYYGSERPTPTVGSVLCNIILAICMKALAIAMIIVGAVDINKCPEQPMVPKYLLVAGTLSVVNGLLHFVIYMLVLCHVQGRMEEDNGALLMDILVVRTFRGVLGLFTTFWYIFAGIYVLNAKPNFYDHESPHYCSEGVYQFALFIVIIAYAFMIFTVFAFCCMCCCICFVLLCGPKGEGRDDYKNPPWAKRYNAADSPTPRIEELPPTPPPESPKSSSPKPQTPPEEVIEKAPPTATTEGTDTSQADAPAAAAASESKP